MALHAYQFNFRQVEACVTTWRKPRRRWTEKKSVLKLLFSVQRLHGFGQVVQHALEASLIAGQLTDFARDQYLFYLRTCQTRWQMARVWESVVTYYTRMRITNDLDRKVYVATGPKPRGATGTLRDR